ncbi:hypothetical protein QTO34_010753 [Cnephaeus nilssonii]|uniref:Uncharacterized protein n=1 Tax=Cnephaeus nilssonii TaxID=3371016 RepID=A0AA40HG73_CNENI|nr:hypothetical protein QTO34_010753 [Eptesicus nilssonii]
MFGPVFKADRLRVNLQLVVNRLKLLKRKKILTPPQPSRPRKQGRVADYWLLGKMNELGSEWSTLYGKTTFVEAMEILELYCDLLLAGLA